MALENTDLLAVAANIMRRWSADWTPLPIGKNAIALVLSEIDGAFDTMEESLPDTVGPATAAWLAAHPEIMRKMIVLLALKRAEVL